MKLINCMCYNIIDNAYTTRRPSATTSYIAYIASTLGQASYTSHSRVQLLRVDQYVASQHSANGTHTDRSHVPVPV